MTWNSYLGKFSSNITSRRGTGSRKEVLPCAHTPFISDNLGLVWKRTDTDMDAYMHAGCQGRCCRNIDENIYLSAKNGLSETGITYPAHWSRVHEYAKLQSWKLISRQ